MYYVNTPVLKPVPSTLQVSRRSNMRKDLNGKLLHVNHIVAFYSISAVSNVKGKKCLELVIFVY